MSNILRIAFVGGLLALAGMLPLTLQSAKGQLQGVVADELGPVAEVTIEAHHVFTGITRRTRSNREGFYRFDELEKGPYSLWVTAAGHLSVQIPRVVVASGRLTTFDITLRTAKTSE